LFSAAPSQEKHVKLDAIGIVSADMKESVRFYRLLGLDFPDARRVHLRIARLIASASSRD
jgi:hypothetical protein